MYPPPGPYAAPQFQPAPPGPPAAPIHVHAPHVWASGEYLLWFAKAQPVRFPLVTTSAPADFGLLGRPSTLVVVGQNDLGFDSINGFRVSAGFFGDVDRRFGAEASGFLLEEKSNITFIESSPAGIPLLARPVIDTTNLRGQAAQVVSAPDFGSGQVLVDTSTQTWGVEGSGVLNLFRTPPGCGGRWAFGLDVLAGYRYLQLTEELNVSTATTLNVPATVTPQFVTGPFGVITPTGFLVTPTPVQFAGIQIFSPAVVQVRDSFKTVNRFNGGQVGLRTEIRTGMYSLMVTGKFAFGHMHQILLINGASGFSDQTRLGAGPAAAMGTAVGGLLATSTNIGKFNNDEFAIIPEVTINLGVNLTRALTAFVGYNFLYVDRVIRPGSQINPVVNAATVPFSSVYGANRPASFQDFFAQDDFWLQGVNFGLLFRY
jgi:hypothetical protein